MPRLSKNAILRPDLAEVAVDYALRRSREGFIGLRCMPIFKTIQKGSEYPVIPIEQLLMAQETARAARADYQRGDWEFEDRDYKCKENGWEEPIDETEAELYADYIDVEEVAVERATDVVLRRQERRIAAQVMNEKNAGGGILTPIATWADKDNADPEYDVAELKDKMLYSSGLEGKVGVMSKRVFKNALQAKKLRDSMQFTAPIETMPMEAKRRLLAQYLDLDDVWVGNAILNTANKTAEKAELAPIWSDDYMALIVPSSGGNDLKEPAFGRTFLWTRDSPTNIVIEQYAETQNRSDIYRARQYTDECTTFVGALALLKGVNAPVPEA